MTRYTRSRRGKRGGEGTSASFSDSESITSSPSSSMGGKRRRKGGLKTFEDPEVEEGFINAGLFKEPFKSQSELTKNVEFSG